MTTDDSITDLDLLAYADGRLDAGRAARVEAYLAERPALRDQIADFARQNADLHACFDRYAEAEIPERMRAVLNGARTERPRWPSAAMRAAAAVVLMLAAGVGGWYAGAGGMLQPDGSRDLVARTASLHEGEPATEPVSAGTPEGTAVLDSLRERAALPARAPELRRHGYRLMKVERVEMQGTRGVVLHYDGRGEQRVDVVLRPRWDETPARVETTTRGDVGLAHWREGPLEVAVAGPRDERELRDLAQALRRSLRASGSGAPSQLRPDEPSLQRKQEVQAANDPDTMVLSPSLSPQPAAIGENVQP
ncbi:Transmembrane transcriptional regulator (anti-sigma factor RsiW) [Limimonas halophila]|uniref:Transmembrane transcriptional regulator (Anti-sigma factor RsiW) n=1 Tax=Limimonas halophila TaxID=1082479 RepID=A0A1G7MAE1_9PROT|nr:hypothetical protein [Limimonas halophila]SDF58209.1 Transmembrane transcriptional regulator (anti-sigma factor RsiW) [Limimonas halophila]